MIGLQCNIRGEALVSNDEKPAPAGPGESVPAFVYPSILSGWLPREEVARQLKLTSETMQRWAREQRGPRFVKIGQDVYYSWTAVREWLEAQQLGPEPKAAKRRGRSA